LERLRLTGETTTIAAVKARLSGVLAGLRQQLLEVPTACSYQANPSDPVLAAEVFRETITRILDRVCQELEKEVLDERRPRTTANRRRAPEPTRRRQRVDRQPAPAAAAGNGVAVG
jgi:hypothetical protein